MKDVAFFRQNIKTCDLLICLILFPGILENHNNVWEKYKWFLLKVYVMEYKVKCFNENV